MPEYSSNTTLIIFVVHVVSYPSSDTMNMIDIKLQVLQSQEGICAVECSGINEGKHFHTTSSYVQFLEGYVLKLNLNLYLYITLYMYMYV